MPSTAIADVVRARTWSVDSFAKLSACKDLTCKVVNAVTCPAVKFLAWSDVNAAMFVALKTDAWLVVS